MMSANLLGQKRVPIREKRLHSISAYYGEIAPLLKEYAEGGPAQRIRTYAQTGADDIQQAVRFASLVEKAAVVIHGPRGCAARAVYDAARRGVFPRVAVTALNERDTITGSEKKLRQSILALHDAVRPEFIFVILAPVVAINNDDVLAVARELEAERGVVVVPIPTDGFKSKNSLTGLDVAAHALFRFLPVDEESQPREESVNVLVLDHQQKDVREMTRLLAALGLSVNVLPRELDRHFRKARRARLSISLDPDAGAYFGNLLEERFGVPWIAAAPPIGTEGVHRWLAAVGGALGRTAEAEALHQRELMAWKLDGKGEALAGRSVYVSLPTTQAWAVARLCASFGANLCGLSVDHLDSTHEKLIREMAESFPALSLHVGGGQLLEEASIVNKLKPDLYLGHSAGAAQAARLGVPSLSMEHRAIAGYAGPLWFLSASRKALLSPALARRLGEKSRPPYGEGWYRKSAHWFIKLEVK